MNDILSAILTQRLIGIIRMKRYHHPVEIAEALVRGGLTILEYTMSGAGALNCVAQVRAELGVRVCCLLYTSPSPRDRTRSRMPSSA